ncbi:hypothetical protein HNY73_013343 [Argiope bruennichi]|uniref:Uncharacterized protein n=1 Tax=Argiope bruennichi TaxID=94029 RepID=A0A8T0F2E7_ARGBR|nr:hypothetical protein HNY73_013343 [Argiope bruennichi]
MTQVLLDNISPPLGGLNSFNEKVQAAFRNNVTVSCADRQISHRKFPHPWWLPDYSIRKIYSLGVFTGITPYLKLPKGSAFENFFFI